MRRSSPDQLNLFGRGEGSALAKLSQRADHTPSGAWNSYFFAVVPPPDAARSIDLLGRRLRQSMALRGELIGPDRYHVSLGGLGAPGEAPRGLVDLLKQIGASVAAPAFDVVFDHIAWFGGSYGKRALVLASSDTLPALASLQMQLHDAMQVANLPDDERFNPHITMLYEKRPAPLAETPRVSFTVRDFVLIRSVHGESRHDHLERWPLSGGRLSAPA
jgi:RNA 2',3'-cyclic 3'-phosphodiesterase